MNWRCQRCTEVLADGTDILCPECLKTMGLPPTCHHNVCDYCGDEWIPPDTIMCDECLDHSEFGHFPN